MSMCYDCPECGEALEFDEDPHGCDFECPACGCAFTVPRVAKRRREKKVDKTLHYILGLLFGPFGILVSGLIDKDGVSYAVRGFIINFALCVGISLVLRTR